MNPEDGPHPWWHQPGWCHHGTAVRRGHEPRRAEYWVLAPNGYWFAVCAECCARDRRIGADWPDLAPLRVTTVTQPAVPPAVLDWHGGLIDGQHPL